MNTRVITGPQKRGFRVRRGEHVLVMYADFPPGARIDVPTGGYVTVVGSTLRPREA